jgi:hypothetical protein
MMAEGIRRTLQGLSMHSPAGGRQERVPVVLITVSLHYPSRIMRLHRRTCNSDICPTHLQASIDERLTVMDMVAFQLTSR